MPWPLFASHQASVFCHGARSFWATVSCWHWAGFLASKFDLHSMGIHTLVFGFSSNPVFKEMLQKFKFLEFILSFEHSILGTEIQTFKRPYQEAFI